MQIINLRYQFADGHTEEIKVMENIVAELGEFIKYEKKVERKENGELTL